MGTFSDRFIARFVRGAQRAAAEPDPTAREIQMAALTANTLARLATSELVDEDNQRMAMMLFVHLMADFSLDIYELDNAEGV
jgi:hypothetical protein